jgi:hypothetical protein
VLDYEYNMPPLRELSAETLSKEELKVSLSEMLVGVCLLHAWFCFVCVPREEQRHKAAAAKAAASLLYCVPLTCAIDLLPAPALVAAVVGATPAAHVSCRHVRIMQLGH